MRGRDQRAVSRAGLSAPGGEQVELEPFDEAIALRQLAAELGDDAPGQRDWPDLVAALGFLPLALHLAAGYLREGDSAAGVPATGCGDRASRWSIVNPADPRLSSSAAGR